MATVEEFTDPFIRTFTPPPRAGAGVCTIAYPVWSHRHRGSILRRGHGRLGQGEMAQLAERGSLRHGSQPMRKDVAELVRLAVAQGWRAEERRSGRILLFSPDGETIVTLHGTPSDVNWRHAAIRQLRRGGFEPNP